MHDLLKKQGESVHICVPLGTKDWMTATDFKQDRISELDWWDDVIFRPKAAKSGSNGPTKAVRITCTPAQHGCGRAAGEKNAALWSSWVVQSVDSTPDAAPAQASANDASSETGTRDSSEVTRFMAFFAGDTGLKFSRGSVKRRDHFPTCPAFAQVAERLGTPDLMLLPISVGSSLSYIKSFDPFPRGYSPFPRVGDSLTSSIHMSPEDAVETHR